MNLCCSLTPLVTVSLHQDIVLLIMIKED